MSKGTTITELREQLDVLNNKRLIKMDEKILNAIFELIDTTTKNLENMSIQFDKNIALLVKINENLEQLSTQIKPTRRDDISDGFTKIKE